MATKNNGEKCLTSKSCRTGFCSPTTGFCDYPHLFQRCNANASKDPCPSNQVCDKTTFRCLPLSSVPKNKGGVGARCQDVSECGPHMTCLSGTCAFTKNTGERCTGEGGSRSGPECKDGTVCLGGFCRDACYTLHGQDNPDWTCKDAAQKCYATGRGVQGICMEPKAIPELIPSPHPPPEPAPITEPSQTPTPAPSQSGPWHQDGQVISLIVMAASIVGVLILATGITMCCVARQRKKQKKRDVEDKRASVVPLEPTAMPSAPMITTTAVATAPQSGVTSPSGLVMAPAMGPELPPSYHDIASASSSLHTHTRSSTSLRTEKSEKHREEGTTHEEEEHGNLEHTSSPSPPQSPPRGPSAPPGSF